MGRVMAEIIEPTVQGLAEMGNPYRGVFFAGLMITAEGPKLIEYNARFGDPETQVADDAAQIRHRATAARDRHGKPCGQERRMAR